MVKSTNITEKAGKESSSRTKIINSTESKIQLHNR